MRSVTRLKGAGRPIQDVHVARRRAGRARSRRSRRGVRGGHAARADPAGASRPCWSRAATTRATKVVGRDIVEADGGEVILVDLVPGPQHDRAWSRARAHREKPNSDDARDRLSRPELERSSSARILRRRAAGFLRRGWRERSESRIADPGISNKPAGRGILVEPLPELASELRRLRKAKVFAVACSSPDHSRLSDTAPLRPGRSRRLDPNLAVTGVRPNSAIDGAGAHARRLLARGATRRAPIDFVSIDVEGHEFEVLRGFDFARWRPRLILLEDHVRACLDKHRFMHGRLSADPPHRPERLVRAGRRRSAATGACSVAGNIFTATVLALRLERLFGHVAGHRCRPPPADRLRFRARLTCRG